MLVDDEGIVQQKNFLVVSSDQGNRRNMMQREPQKSIDEPQRTHKSRYEYISLSEQNGNRVHRYATIPSEEPEDSCKQQSSGRYALVPVEDLPLTSK